MVIRFFQNVFGMMRFLTGDTTRLLRRRWFCFWKSCSNSSWNQTVL